MTQEWIAPGSHSVQFYIGEQFAHHAIAEFFTRDATPGDPLILMAQSGTFRAVARQLSSGPYDQIGNAVERLQFVDADVVLPRIMRGEALDPARARGFFGDLFARIGSFPADGSIRLYGELVDVLCERGHHAAALEVEGLVPGLFEVEPRLSILCGYCIDRFRNDADMARQRAVFGAHSHLVTTGGTDGTPGEVVSRGAPVVQLFSRSLRGSSLSPAVYVIDDDASMRKSLARLLACSNWPVQTFDSAEGFLAEMDGLSSGCLVVDIQLPGMSGIDLLIRLREAGAAWPIVAMSGSDNEGAECEALRLGVRSFLRKPFEPQTLLDAIAELLL